jgi:hypothetical protein
VKERAGDSGRGSREHREDRPAFDFAHVHHAAVGAHDHQRRRDARGIDRRARHARGAQHARQDRSVERRGAGARAQAVHRRNFAAARRREPACARIGDERVFTLRTVDRERIARHQRIDAGRAHALEPRIARAVLRVQIGRAERDTGRQRDRRETHRRAGEARSEPHDADPRDVAFEQRVGGLRRGVRDERDRRRIDRVLTQQLFEAGDDAGGDAVGMIVRRRHLDHRDQFARSRIDGHDVGERAADVDADANVKRRRAPRSSADASRSLCCIRSG